MSKQESLKLDQRSTLFPDKIEYSSFFPVEPKKIPHMQMKSNWEDLWKYKEIGKIPLNDSKRIPNDPKAKTTEVQVIKKSQWPLPLDLYLDKIGFQIIKQMDDKEKWKDFIVTNVGSVLSDERLDCCYNALREIYRSNYTCILEALKKEEMKVIGSSDHAFDYSDKFSKDTLECIKQLTPLINDFDPMFSFIVTNVIVIYYEIIHLPRFIRTFRIGPKLNDEEKLAFDIFTCTLNIARSYFSNRIFYIPPYLPDWHYFIDCLLEILKEIHCIMQKSKSIADLINIILSVLGIYFSYGDIKESHDLAVVETIYQNQKATDIIRINAAKILCCTMHCEGPAEFLLWYQKRNIGDVEMEFNMSMPVELVIWSSIEVYLFKVLKKKNSVKGKASYLTSADYNLIIGTESRKYINELTENIMEIFNRENLATILIKIKNKEELENDEKIAVNCLYAQICNISKYMFHIKRDSQVIYNFDFLKPYLEPLFDYIIVDIVAMRLTEAILYALCNIFHVSLIKYETYWSRTLLKYFQSKDCSMEIKLASAVAISYVASHLKMTQIGHIITFLCHLPCFNVGIKSLSTTNWIFLGFQKEEIDRTLNRFVVIWIKCFQTDIQKKSNMDANFLSLIYEALLSMKERSAHLSPMNIFNLSNEIIRMFNMHFKSEIINKLKDKSTIQETEKLALNSVYVSVNILGYCVQSDPSLINTLDDEYIRDIFHSFFNLMGDSAIALRICESILYTLCNICFPEKIVINRDFWIPKLRECFIQKSSSQEIKLASSIILGRMTMENEEVDFDILYYLLQIATDLTDETMEYLGFSFPEIIDTIAHMIQVLSRYIQTFSITRADERGNHLANVNQMLCNIYHKPPIKHDLYRLNLTNLIVSVMKSFSLELKQSILHKLTHQIVFSDIEKIYLNCFCNAGNVLGQHIHYLVEDYSISNCCDLIFIYLTDLEQSVEHSGIALRVAEILLYCLCNILMSKSICNGKIWKDILWRYFIKEKSSNEIKMASGIAMAHVWKIGGSYSGGDHSKLRDYLRDIYGNLGISTPDYLGFSSDSIKQSLLKMG